MTVSPDAIEYIVIPFAECHADLDILATDFDGLSNMMCIFPRPMPLTRIVYKVVGVGRIQKGFNWDCIVSCESKHLVDFKC